MPVQKIVVPLHSEINEMISFFDSVAQLVEQLTLNQWVEGSSPSGVTEKMANKQLHSLLAVFLFSYIPEKLYRKATPFKF